MRLNLNYLNLGLTVNRMMCEWFVFGCKFSIWCSKRVYGRFKIRLRVGQGVDIMSFRPLNLTIANCFDHNVFYEVKRRKNYDNVDRWWCHRILVTILMTSMARPISGRLCNSMIITALHQIETRACNRHLDGRR